MKRHNKTVAITDIQKERKRERQTTDKEKKETNKNKKVQHRNCLEKVSRNHCYRLGSGGVDTGKFGAYDFI